MRWLLGMVLPAAAVVTPVFPTAPLFPAAAVLTLVAPLFPAAAVLTLEAPLFPAAVVVVSGPDEVSKIKISDVSTDVLCAC